MLLLIVKDYFHRISPQNDLTLPEKLKMWFVFTIFQPRGFFDVFSCPSINIGASFSFLVLHNPHPLNCHQYFVDLAGHPTINYSVSLMSSSCLTIGASFSLLILHNPHHLNCHQYFVDLDGYPTILHRFPGVGVGGVRGVVSVKWVKRMV